MIASSDPIRPTADEFDGHVGSQDNPHGVTAAQVGLGNVDNTADADKPVSTATQAALDGKSDVGHNHDGAYDAAGSASAVGAALSAHEAQQTEAHGGIVASDDARLTDERTPVDGSVTTDKIAGEAVTNEKVANETLTVAKFATAVKASLLAWLAPILDVAGGVPTLDDNKALVVNGINVRKVLDTDDTDVAGAGELVAVVDDLDAPTTFSLRLGDGTTKTGELEEIAGVDWATIDGTGNLILDPGEGNDIRLRNGTGGAAVLGGATSYVRCESDGVALGNFADAAAYQITYSTSAAIPPANDQFPGKLITVGATTTNDTPTELLPGFSGFSGKILMPTADCAWDCTIRIVAKQSSSSNAMRFDRSCLLVKEGGAVALVGTVDTLGSDKGNQGWSVSVEADDTNGALKIVATGAAGTSIRWAASIHLMQVTN